VFRKRLDGRDQGICKKHRTERQVNKPAQFRPGLLSFFFRKELQVIDIDVPLLHELQRHDMDAFGELNLGEVPADPPSGGKGCLSVQTVLAQYRIVPPAAWGIAIYF
jgi:hypothetical protein